MLRRSLTANLKTIILLCALHLGGAIPAAQAQSIPYHWSDTTLAKRLLDESREHVRQSEDTLAIQKAQQGRDIFLALYGENHVKTAKAGMYLAHALRGHYRIDAAQALFEQSLQIFEAAQDTLNLALCHKNLGLCMRNQRRYGLAQQHIRTAIGLLQPGQPDYTVYLQDFRVALATVLLESKNFLAAVPVLETTQAEFAAAGETYKMGIVGYRLGEAYFGLQDYARAKEHFQSSLAYLKSQLPESHPNFADLNMKIGLCCQKTGDAEAGLTYLQTAKAAYMRHHPGSPHVFKILKALGQFYVEEKRYAEAIVELELCYALCEKWFGTESHYLASILSALAEARFYAGQFAEAEACLSRARHLAENSLDHRHPLKGRLLVQMAALRLAQTDYDACRASCTAAFEAYGFDPAHPERAVPRDPFREICLLNGQAFAGRYRRTRTLPDLERAEQYYAMAAQTLFREVEEITVNSARELFYDRDHQVLDLWLESRMLLYAVTGDPEHAEAAFQIAGQSKAFLLSEAMQHSGALRFAGVPDSVLQEEMSLRTLIVEAEKDLETRARGLDSLALERSRELACWRRDYDELLVRIGNEYPRYYQARQIRKPVGSDEMRQALQPGQGLLLYSLTDSMTCLFVLTRDTFCARTLPQGEAELNALIEPFRNSFTNYHTATEPDDALYETCLEANIRLAQTLYQMLVQPVASLLPERLIIVPEGQLYFLPFEALLTADPKDPGNFRTYPFWLREKAIAYGLSTRHILNAATPPPAEAEREWLGIAPFAAGDASGTVSRNDSLQPLPHSGREIRTIADLLGGDVWLGDSATKERFLREAPLYRILHLATHSKADARQGDYSWLQVAASGKPMPAKDLYQCTLAAEMVVLSACEAGGGRLLRGEGIVGLVRALTYAGARSIVASAWVSDDQGTADMMVEFYRQLRQGKTRDQALRAARLYLVDRKPAAAHPFFWAGFRVYGG